ncbi:MAG TPA: ATP-binding protein [Vicinamibacterales bacterium]
MQVECVILIGLPASGKTTFYHERFAGTHEHVSKDLLRNNRRADRRQEELISQSLSAGRSVVVDNTNASVDVRARLVALARAHGAVVTGYYFPTEPADALRRNRARTGRQRVPDVAVFAIRKRLEPPSLQEGFDRLFTVLLDEQKGGFVVAPYSR